MDATDQPIGEPVPGWSARALPPRTPMVGRFCRVEPLDVERHGPDLHDAFAEDVEGRGWTYLFVGPFDDEAGLRDYLTGVAGRDDPLFHVVVDARTGRAVGFASFMRVEPELGSIEIGNIHFSVRMRRTPIATEAVYLMVRRAFDELGYRRCEWKCDSLNAPSRRAAERFGFAYEGRFRQALVYKGRNRDTAWYSIVDGEWPALRAGFEAWLDAGNFDADGAQRRSLGETIRRTRTDGA